jgi:hypothetical protein
MVQLASTALVDISLTFGYPNRMQKTLLVLSLLALGVGCGPSISEVRMIAAPPREPTCELEFLNLTIEQLSPAGTHEILGDVVLAQSGIQDPYQPKYRDIVRPRACAMGGEAVTILNAATSSSAMGSGSTTVYAIVRKRAAPSAVPAPPAKF